MHDEGIHDSGCVATRIPYKRGYTHHLFSAGMSRMACLPLNTIPTSVTMITTKKGITALNLLEKGLRENAMGSVCM